MVFRAFGNVRVRLREVDRLGGLLDRMTASGVDNLTALNLVIAKPEPLPDQARVKAIRKGGCSGQVPASRAMPCHLSVRCAALRPVKRKSA